MNAGFKRAATALARLYPLGVSLLWRAPLVLALVVVPEFLQHIAEIQLGMFDSRERAIAVSDHPTRWAFGFAKIAGLVLTLLAAARFWWTLRHGGRWWDVRTLAWRRLALGFLLFGLLPAAPVLFQAQFGKAATDAIGLVITLILLPMLFLLLAGLFGDRTTPAAAMWRRGWPWLLLTALLAVLAFVPAQWLHGMNHEWAFGADPPVVWALMIFDSVLVGLLAGLTGTAFYLGYEAFREAEQASAFAPHQHPLGVGAAAP